MKKFFKSEIGRRVLIAAGMIALAVGLGLIFQDMLKSDSVWVRAAFSVGCFGTVLVAIYYIIASWRGLLMGYGMLLFVALPLALPEPWNRYFVALAFFLFFAMPTILRYLRRKNKKNDDLSEPNDMSEEDEQIDEQAAALQKQGQAPIIVQRTSNGGFYQVLVKEDGLVFYRICGVWSEFGEAKLIDENNPPPLGKKDFTIAFDDVTTLRFHEIPQNDSLFDTRINIYADKKRYYLATLMGMSGAKLAKTLQSRVPKNAQKERKPDQYGAPAPDQKRKAVLRRVYFGICAFALIVDVSWMFLDVPYMLFAWLALLPVPALLMLYYLFPNEISPSDSKKTANGRIEIVAPLFITAIIPVLRVLLDFNILTVGRFFLTVGVLLVLLVTQAYATSKECRKRKAVLVSLAFALAIYLVGMTGEVNYLLDTTPPQQISAVVDDMHVSTGSRSPDRYILSVRTQDRQEYDLQVLEAYYQKLDVGDDVTVLVFQGALGIRYADIDEVS